ncbi:MAG: hypothetical protein FJY29_01635 [Betaproteobacteria bacterium]|nr:hypothetical protein [Betaproteobacteria bacterium]
MDIKALRELAQKYTVEELNAFVMELENTGSCSCSQKADPGDVMSDLLQAIEVRHAVDQGQSLQDAIREFSKRVRAVLS